MLIGLKVKIAMLSAVVMLGAYSWPAVAKQEPLTFGVVPQQSASRLAEVWVPLLTEVAEQLGREIRFVTAKDIPAFERCLASQAYDISYMNPLHYVTFKKHGNYEAFAHRSGPGLQGIIVARKDAGIKKIEQLNGKKVAFPSPAAFGASIIPRSEFKRRGIEFSSVYVKSHDSVYRSVAAGFLPAGGGVGRTLNTIPETLRDQLEIIYRTRHYTPHALATHWSVDPATIARLGEIFSTLHETAPQVLKPLGIKAFQHAKDSDWADVRELISSNADIDLTRISKQQCH